eukprot:9496210-Pyramimonas_sp.AAC.1
MITPCGESVGIRSYCTGLGPESLYPRMPPATGSSRVPKPCGPCGGGPCGEVFEDFEVYRT